MRSSIIAFGIAALTAVTQAVPTEQAKRDLYVRSASADVSCGNDQVISCCNTNKATSDSNNGGLLGLGGLLDGVLGGSCSPLGLGILGAGVPVTDACGNNVAACCTGDQNGGLLNLQCTTLNIL
ncbi:uncharacterized protein PV06_02172 [Exophiala oligosperma]|uniref:Hydrophobin n=2 Tax=Chaetothyriales TaxID=34395 RepID=A0A0D2DTR3_9EURO|nr:uncharacterized protein PV06_02172 [Exophiala oligosperma]KAJ9629114.1 hypothetical protein H2204_009054 [Knufia peltigerae]KIW46503.1 hypothetical protein PV06_02172 [Exophiala oligosperma]